jgi:oxalate decarboxylase/phosphoglucose isomerase-like protein (cupin superfamily)
MKFNINKFKGKTVVMKVKDAIRDRKNIYKNIKGHENELNEVLIDLPDKKTGLRNLTICMNTLYPGKVNGEFKMMRGHFHNAEEVYLVLSGNGQIKVGNEKIPIKKGDLITIHKNVWHRTINTGKKKLVFLTIFEKHKGSHLKSY